MSSPFIRRPVATTLLFIAIIVVGLIGFASLPAAPLPNVDLPTFQVTTTYPGASPDVVETTITAPLEHNFGSISGLKLMSSTSSAGTSQITLQFVLSRNVDGAAQDIQAAIDAAGGQIPTALLPGPPTYRRVNPADAPVLILALTSATLPLPQINDSARTVLIQKLSQISGVGEVDIEGDQTRAIRVQIDPSQAAAMQLSLEDIRNALTATTIDLPKGSLDGPRQAFEINANDQIFEAAAFNDTVIAYRDGAPVHLRDIGKAIEGAEDAELAATYNGKPAVLLDVRRQPGANAIEVADSVKRLLASLRSSLPEALDIAVVADRTQTIRASVADVEQTLVITVCLVVLIIFLFLRKLWATIIPSVALPVSLIATFGLIAPLGFSLNNLSLMALTVASGFVVDDAIVMIENITRYIEAGDRPFEAAIKGSKQIGFTVVSLTVSLIAVFVPLLLMEGLMGRLLWQFAVTLSLAVIVSALVSLTLTPMMCATLLRSDSDAHEQGNGRFSSRLVAFYERGLDWVLAHQAFTLAIALLTAVLSVWLYVAVPKNFLPEQDSGLLVGTTEAPQDISFAAMADRQNALARAIGSDPQVVAVSSFVGVGTINPTLNSGRMYVNIGPSTGRPDAHVLIERLQARASKVTGIALHLQSVQDLSVETRATPTRYQLVLNALDEGELGDWSRRLLGEMRRRPQFSDATSDSQDKSLEVAIDVDRAAASRFNVSMEAVDQILYDAFGQRQITQIYSPLLQYHVILEVYPSARSDPSILDKIFVAASSPSGTTGLALAGSMIATGGGSTGMTSGNGLDGGFARASTMVPLSAFARFRKQTGALAISHQGLFPAVTISFNLGLGFALGDALAALGDAQRKIAMPPTITATLTGTAAEFVASLRNETWLVIGATFSVYIVLGILYESFVHPLTILSTLPSAGVGALLAMILTGTALDTISLVGIVLLIGIAKKNAIMMVDFALEAERLRGATARAAIREACLLRFRPIIMTTMAALLGALPLALGTGIGSELRRPLGIAIVGGLIVSQTLTLYTTPVIYLAADRLRRMFGHGGMAPRQSLQAEPS